MTADHETAAIVRRWLRDDAHESAERVVDRVLLLLDTTPQHRPWWPVRRITDMQTPARLVLAAGALVVFVVAGLSLLPISPRSGGSGAPASTTAAPSPSPSPSPTPSPSRPPADVQPPAGPLQPGERYAVGRGGTLLSMAFPNADWNSDGRFWFHGHQGTADLTELTLFPSSGTPGIYTDPCAHEGLRQFAPSAAGEAEAIASLEGVTVIDPPTPTTVDGHRAVTVAISVPTRVPCSNTDYWLEHDPACGEILACTSYPTWLGSTMRFWFVDLDEANRFMFEAETMSPAATAGLSEELRQIVESIRFE